MPDAFAWYSCPSTIQSIHPWLHVQPAAQTPSPWTSALTKLFSLHLEMSFISETCLRPCLSDYPKRLLPSRRSKCYPSFKSWLESRYCTKPSLISPGPNHPFLLSSSSCYDLGCWLCHLLHDILLGLSAPLQMCSMDHLVFTGLCFPTIS